MQLRTEAAPCYEQTFTEGYFGVTARELAFANMHKITSIGREGMREGDKDIIRVAGIDFLG